MPTKTEPTRYRGITGWNGPDPVWETMIRAEDYDTLAQAIVQESAKPEPAVSVAAIRQLKRHFHGMELRPNSGKITSTECVSVADLEALCQHAEASG